MTNLFYKIVPVSLTEKMLLTRNLAVMIKSGVPLPRALKILHEQIKHVYFKKALFLITQDIQKGSSLADALSKHKRIFNQFYINMIKVGELSGNLENVFNLLAEQMQKEHQIITKVRGAMIYPALILFTLISVGIGMLVFVIPKLMTIFTEMQVKLPWSTRLFLEIASNIRLYGSYFALIILILIIGFYFYRRTAKGRKVLHCLLLYLPFFGKMSQRINLTRFASNLSSLLQSGISLLDALSTVKGILANRVYRLSLEEVSQKVQKGENLSKALALYPKLYSPLLIQMLEVGEETGTTTDALAQIAQFYQNEIDEAMKNISSLIEPILMLIIGGLVGFFAISMISPIYSMLQGL